MQKEREERNGRGERIRTSDPLLPKQVRYQTALRPETLVVDLMPAHLCVMGMSDVSRPQSSGYCT